MIPDPAIITSASLLILRGIIAVIFFSSGKSHVQDPAGRGKRIGMPPSFTRILGILEVAAAVSIAFGIFLQWGAAIIIITMLGAIYKKLFVWHTGFYATEGYGWHYDLLLLSGALVLMTTSGGAYVLF